MKKSCVLIIIGLSIGILLRIQEANQLEKSLITCKSSPFYCNPTTKIALDFLEHLVFPQTTQHIFDYLTQVEGFQDLAPVEYQVNRQEGYLFALKAAFNLRSGCLCFY